MSWKCVSPRLASSDFGKLTALTLRTATITSSRSRLEDCETFAAVSPPRYLVPRARRSVARGRRIQLSNLGRPERLFSVVRSRPA
jgi:hypothetical protein